jgi:poly-beta-hydroxyalkanoate depolymerase
MLYQAYQAHADIMGPVRKFAGIAARAVGERLNGAARPTVLSNLTAAYELIARAGLTHERPAYGIDVVTVNGEEVAVTEEAADYNAVRYTAAFQKRLGSRSAACPAGRSFVRAFRNAVAHNRANDAAGARRLHYRLAQRTRRGARAWPFRF